MNFLSVTEQYKVHLNLSEKSIYVTRREVLRRKVPEKSE